MRSRTNCKLSSCWRAFWVRNNPSHTLSTAPELLARSSVRVRQSRWVKYGCPPLQCSTRFSSRRPTSGRAESPSDSGMASCSVKSVSSTRRPTLKGVVRVSRIKSDGVATPNRQNVRRFSSESWLRRLWSSRMPAKNSSAQNGRLRTASISSTKITTLPGQRESTTCLTAAIQRCIAPRRLCWCQNSSSSSSSSSCCPTRSSKPLYHCSEVRFCPRPVKSSTGTEKPSSRRRAAVRTINDDLPICRDVST